MKLISMTDFVLEQELKSIKENYPVETDEYFNTCVNYAYFLKKPLKLEMFVPCDDNGNVLKEPYNDGYNDMYYGALFDEYQQAKEKVLFLRFDGSDFDYSLAKVYLENYFNIEQLSNEVKEQILTKNAIKQLGL